MDQPIPVNKISPGSVEDTLLLLEIVKEKQQEENRKQKVSGEMLGIEKEGF